MIGSSKVGGGTSTLGVAKGGTICNLVGGSEFGCTLGGVATVVKGKIV